MGPFDNDTIRAMIANGQAEGYHECSADRREWRPLDLIPEFAPERHVRRSKPGSEPAVPLAPASGHEERRGIGFNAFGAVVAAAVLLILVGGSTTLYLVLRKPTDLAKPPMARVVRARSRSAGNRIPRRPKSSSDPSASWCRASA